MSNTDRPQKSFLPPFYLLSTQYVIHVILEPKRSPLFFMQAIKAGDKAEEEAIFNAQFNARL